MRQRGRGRLVDRFTQLWVRATGRLVDLDEHPWLDGPVGDPYVIGDEWIGREATRLCGTVTSADPDAGLLPAVEHLAGDGFDPSGLDPMVRDFYEHTSRWRLDLWFQWCPVAWPFGWLLSAVFARRLKQLSLPLRPLEAAHGMDSQIIKVIDAQSSQVGAAWHRTMRATSETVYSGWYGVAQLPDSEQPSVRVVFPLPNGSVIVFLRPERHGRDLVLISPDGSFGEDGAYLVVREPVGAEAWVRRVPIHERFQVGPDEEGVLRTDHHLALGPIPVIDLHYRLERGPTE